MKKITTLLLGAIVAFSSSAQTVQQSHDDDHHGSCPVMITPTVLVTPDCYHPNWWLATFVAQSKSKSTSIELIITVQKILGRDSTFHVCMSIERCDDKEYNTYTFRMYSLVKPVVHWKAYTTDCSGTPCNGDALPVRFTSFSGEKDNSSVVLRWTAAVENEEGPFVIERSYDGITFKKISTVQQNQSGSYLARDVPSFERGSVFYRISLNDHKTSIIKIWGTATVTYTATTTSLFMSKPATALTRITAVGSGQIMVESKDQTINTTTLPAGAYAVTIIFSDGTAMKLKKFLKQ